MIGADSSAVPSLRKETATTMLLDKDASQPGGDHLIHRSSDAISYTGVSIHTRAVSSSSCCDVIISMLIICRLVAWDYRIWWATMLPAGLPWVRFLRRQSDRQQIWRAGPVDQEPQLNKDEDLSMSSEMLSNNATWATSGGPEPRLGMVAYAAVGINCAGCKRNAQPPPPFPLGLSSSPS